MFKLVFEGAKNGLDEKLKSPFWGSIILSWLTWNWKVWYVTFFVSEKLTGNKIDYISNSYIFFSKTIFGFSHLNVSIFIGYIFNWILMPIIITWTIIYFITPKISIMFLKKHQKNKEIENNIITKEIKSDTKKEQAELKKLEQELLNEKIKYQKEIAIQKQEIKKLEIENQNNNIEEKKWDKEYVNLINKYNELINSFKNLIIDKKGESHSFDRFRNRNISQVLEEVLVFNDLIEEKERIHNGNAILYKITSKGKYFLKKSTLD